jgi:peptide/nickel transport system substrate-binding protein
MIKRTGALLAALAVAGTAEAQTTFRVVNHSDLKILDPIWTTAYIVRNHGYMIYDVLFALDGNLEIKPQMVDKWTTSPDKLTWTFTLRDGLEFHDGTPVTAEDVVPSLKRWAARTPYGQLLWTKVADVKALDPKTFQIQLKAPTGIMLQALSQPSGAPSSCPRRWPRPIPSSRSTTTPARARSSSSRTNGSPARRRSTSGIPSTSRGRAGLRPGRRQDRQARAGRMGGDPRPADGDQRPDQGRDRHDRDAAARPLKMMEASPDVKLVNLNKWGNQYVFRFNHLFKPFDNPKIRQALLYAFNQKDFLDGVIGDPRYYKVCKAMFMCDTPYASTKGFDDKFESNFAKAKELLKEGGYDGTPVLLMHSSDLQILANLAPVAKQLMERAGMKVDMQSMDWSTLVSRRARKDPPDKGGWNAFLTSSASVDIVDPLANTYINAVGENAWFGWPTDPELVKMRAAFADEPTTPSARRSPRPCRCACRRARPTSSPASGSCRRRCARTSAATSNRR